MRLFTALCSRVKARSNTAKENHRDKTVQVYLYIKGITEETADLQRLIYCTDYDQSFRIPGGMSPKPNFSDAIIMKPVDQRSPALQVAALTNLRIPTMTFYFYCTQSQQVRYMVTLQDVILTSVEQYIAKDVSNLYERLTIDFTRIQWVYGVSKAGWSLVDNQPI